MARTAETLAERQNRTHPAREALAGRFESAEQRSEHYRALGRRSANSRFVLSGDEAEALVNAYAILGRIAERARQKIESSPQEAA
jgi:hypothetical protein